MKKTFYEKTFYEKTFYEKKNFMEKTVQWVKWVYTQVHLTEN